jgi:hypothetical protein
VDLNTLENKGMGAKRKKIKSEPVAPLSPTLIDISTDDVLRFIFSDFHLQFFILPQFAV